jgi:hypothetical protein
LVQRHSKQNIEVYKLETGLKQSSLKVRQKKRKEKKYSLKGKTDPYRKRELKRKDDRVSTCKFFRKQSVYNGPLLKGVNMVLPYSTDDMSQKLLTECKFLKRKGTQVRKLNYCDECVLYR